MTNNQRMRKFSGSYACGTYLTGIHLPSSRWRIGSDALVRGQRIRRPGGVDGSTVVVDCRPVHR